MRLKINEIFYSLQGEGARAGSANIFIRLQGCKTKHACFASGVFCDTEFESGLDYDFALLTAKLEQFRCKNIIWTGGEPAEQLTEDIVGFFRGKNYFQAIETSGLFSVPKNLDYVAVSPKVAEHVIAKNFPNGADELRYVRRVGQGIPQPAVKAKHYYISPHSDGDQVNAENLEYCIELVKQNPLWKLSVQNHKIWNIR